MIPNYQKIKELKIQENDISIRFMFQLFQLKTHFIKNPDIFKKSSQNLFIKLKLENDKHASLSFVVFSDDYKEILYETSTLASRRGDHIFYQDKLKTALRSDYIKYIDHYITYNHELILDDAMKFNNKLNENNIRYLLYQMKLSINDINILTEDETPLIEIVVNPTESYLIYKPKYQTPWS